jgi:hypothetical protein
MVSSRLQKQDFLTTTTIYYHFKHPNYKEVLEVIENYNKVLIPVRSTSSPTRSTTARSPMGAAEA